MEEGPISAPARIRKNCFHYHATWRPPFSFGGLSTRLTFQNRPRLPPEQWAWHDQKFCSGVKPEEMKWLGLRRTGLKAQERSPVTKRSKLPITCGAEFDPALKKW